MLAERAGSKRQEEAARCRRRSCSTAASSRPTRCASGCVEVLDALGQGGRPAVRELHGADLDLAVARGAAYYGLVRRGKGVRIRGGAARAYYIGVETVAARGPRRRRRRSRRCASCRSAWRKGTEADVPGQEFGLVVGEPAEFRFLGSTIRRDDAVGTVVEDWEGQIEELAPLSTTLEAPGKARAGRCRSTCTAR